MVALCEVLLHFCPNAVVQTSIQVTKESTSILRGAGNSTLSHFGTADVKCPRLLQTQCSCCVWISLRALPFHTLPLRHSAKSSSRRGKQYICVTLVTKKISHLIQSQTGSQSFLSSRFYSVHMKSQEKELQDDMHSLGLFCSGFTTFSS